MSNIPTPRTDAAVVKAAGRYQILYPSLHEKPVHNSDMAELEKAIQETVRVLDHVTHERDKWREVAEEMDDYVQYEDSPKFLELRKRFHKLKEASK